MRVLFGCVVFFWGCLHAWGDREVEGGALDGWWVLYADDVNSLEWFATLRIDHGAIGGDGAVSGEISWDTPTEVRSGFWTVPARFGREFFEGSYDAAARGVVFEGYYLEGDMRIGSATYEATLAPGGDVLSDGSWDGNTVWVVDSDFFVATRGDLVAGSEFDGDVDGWSGALRRDGEGWLVVGPGAGERVVAPASFHGDWRWSGRVPTLVSFDAWWSSDGRPDSGPAVTVTGAGGEASFVVDDEGAFVTNERRTYIVPLRGDAWEKEGDASWGELLENVDGFSIRPGGDAAGEFFVDEIRVIRPVVRPEPRLIEWDFGGGSLAAASGSGTVKGFSGGLAGPDTIVAADPEVGEGAAGEADEWFLSLPKIIGNSDFGLSDESVGLQLSPEGIEGNGGGRWVNRYTMIWDLKIAGDTYTKADFDGFNPADPSSFDYHKSAGVWLFQPRGRGHGLAIEYGRISGDGIDLGEPDRFGFEWNPLIEMGEWYRVVMSVDAQAGELTVYVNGVEVFDEGGDPENHVPDRVRPAVDGGFALELEGETRFLPRMFGGAGQQGNDVELAGVAFLDVALPAGQVAALGGVGGGGILQPVFDVGFGIDAVATPGSMTLGFDGYAGWNYLWERSEDLCLWEVTGDVVAGGGIRVQKEVRLDERPAEYHRVRPIVD